MNDPLAISNLPARAASTRPAGEPRTREAIARAAQRTGVDFDYLLAQARLESSLDPAARARTSSATGLCQFIDSTWLSTMDRHGDALGFGPVAAAIDTQGGRARVGDPNQRQAILALRFDPQASALMAGALASDNRTALTGVLGREPDHAELYLAHFLGAAGASRMLGELQSNPDTSAAAILPAPAAANRAIFYAADGRQRSVGEVMQVIRSKMSAAIESGAREGGAMLQGNLPMGDFAAAAAEFRTAIPARESYRPQPQSLDPLPPIASPGTSSMADTLRSSFGVAGGAMTERSRSHVAGAYARLQAFRL